MNIAGIHWANSKALAALGLVPVLVVWAEVNLRARKKNFERFADPSLWSRIAPELDWAAPLTRWSLAYLAVIFAVLALARPQWGEIERIEKTTGADVMIALDVSQSMDTEDVPPNRLKKAQHLIRGLLDRLPGERVGLVAFAGNAQVISPLTTDLDYLRLALGNVNSRSIPVQGTDLGGALSVARTALREGSEEGSGDPEVSASQSSRTLVLLSDGEDHEDAALQAARNLAQDGVRVLVVGLGTAEGGPIPVRDEQGQARGQKRDRRGELVVSRFRPDALQALAKEAQGKYWQASLSEAELESLVSEINSANRRELNERKIVIREERFLYPLALAILFYLLHLALPVRGKPRGVRAAVWVWAAMGLGMSWAAPNAQASEARPGTRAFIQNEQGVRAAQRGDWAKARKELGTAQALEPDSTVARYNQGTLHLQQGEPEQASAALEKAARDSESAENPQLSGLAWFNAGVASAIQQKTDPAVAAYAQAIRQAQRAGDRQLEEDARNNLIQLILVPQGKGEGKDSKEKDPSQKEPGGKGQSGESEPEKKESKVEDPSQSRRKYKPTKLTAEDAQKVLEELARKEQELQAKVQRRKQGKPDLDKDW